MCSSADSHTLLVRAVIAQAAVVAVEHPIEHY